MKTKLATKTAVFFSGVCLLGLAGCSDLPYRLPAFPTVAQTSQPDALVRLTQVALIRLGYLRDVADGYYGPRTRAAIESFQEASGLPQDGAATWVLLARLNLPTAVAASSAPTAAPVSDTPTIPAQQAADSAGTTTNTQWVQPPKAATSVSSAATSAPAKTASTWVSPASTP